jgi:uncharacterized protein involved in exopolysaccharide biosynthesis
MTRPNSAPENPMPVRTPGLADALRRLAGNPQAGGPAPRSRMRRPTSRSIEDLEARARELLAVVRRQSRPFAAVFFATLFVLGAVIALQTPQFESTALLMLKIGRELIYTPEVGDQPAIASRDKQTVVNSELAIMRSEPVVAGVVTTVGLANLYPDLGEALAEANGDPEAEQIAASLQAQASERLREALVVLALPEADVLQVSFRHPDAAVAKDTVNALIDKFTEAHLGAFSEPQVVKFLDQRVKSFRESLDAAEGALREFELAHPVFAEEAPPAALTKRLEERRAQIAALDTQISQVKMSAIGDRSALADAQRERLGLELEASKVKGHLRDNAVSRMAVVSHFIAARRGEVDAQVAALQQQRQQLQTELAAAEKEREQLPALSAQHRDLERERAADEEQYNTYEKRLRDARFSHEMDSEKIASISVIQNATVAPKPVSPLPPILAVPVVLVLALLLAGLTATFADYYGWHWPGTWPGALKAERVREGLRDELYRLTDHVRRR